MPDSVPDKDQVETFTPATHFICSSNKAPVMEMAKPLVKQFLALRMALFFLMLYCSVM